MEGMKWRRCLIHFESKGGGQLEERDNPFHPGSSQWRQDQTFSHAPLHPAAAAEPLNVRLSLPLSPHSVSREIISNQGRICSGRSTFCCHREECLRLQKLHIHTLPDQRWSGPHKNAQSEGLFYPLSQRAPCNPKLDSPRGIRLNHIHLDAAKNFRSCKISNSDSKEGGEKFKAFFGVYQSVKALPSMLDMDGEVHSEFSRKMSSPRGPWDHELEFNTWNTKHKI